MTADIETFDCLGESITIHVPGIVGGGLATITETCRAYRLQRLQKGAPEAVSTKLAAITHYAGWFPRFLLHVASFGVLN